MSTDTARGNVIELAPRRDARDARDAVGGATPDRQPRTLIIRVTLWCADREIHRQVGINDAMPLTELHRVLSTCFGFHGHAAGSPWSFTVGARVFRADGCVHDVLVGPGDTAIYTWGLWRMFIEVIESYPRDRGTPRALCIGGSGSLPPDGSGPQFDPADINAELTGTETITSTLALVDEAVSDLINRSRIFDFIPLLQALDLARPVHLDDRTRTVLDTLPLEETPEAHDAFLVTVLTLSSLVDADLGDNVIEATMAEIGWVDDEGGVLTADRARGLCAESLRALTGVGGYGTGALPPVERLDLYRYLLRR
ncbi:hypothetical protein [Corynebacterium pygosceleis]|uniref:Uncharacterized protein n=1 Tax=Corynebacterium pygosceleis TaxID=2800406 RepID=A0ABT3WTW4_9CORY|nr:hypothetical protein [Corynebacterium pygosceleis]MCK7675955.1 plasmid pRiA4b ORF-3 family protein [Corynebacterium pygosceleis]MCL0119919.1 plasmid pRiA4b ORF-3 family protein [Corynebacterium pygosceleis]MCX7445208.1 hypothetical protein [Corynebacterium pygosceleis]